MSKRRLKVRSKVKLKKFKIDYLTYALKSKSIRVVAKNKQEAISKLLSKDTEIGKYHIIEVREVS